MVLFAFFNSTIRKFKIAYVALIPHCISIRLDGAALDAKFYSTSVFPPHAQ